MNTQRKYGWIKDTKDHKDHVFVARTAALGEYEPVDLRPNCPPVLDQQELGACTAFATTTMVHFVRSKQGLDNWIPSPLFTYYTTRQIEGTIYEDAGAQVRDALKSTVQYGVVPEQNWPYEISHFADQPPIGVYEEAHKHLTLKYKRLSDGCLVDILECLKEGYPFTFGAMIYESFESEEVAATGIVPIPDFNKETCLGGHCMLGVGWTKIEDQTYIIVQNSWSTNWGDKGFCYIPAVYITNASLVGDFWTIRLES
jgi:C1A family cysteine protease